MTNLWKTIDCITIYYGRKKWKLRIKKKNNKVEIHGGWNRFKKDLELKLGDFCLFTKRNNQRRFNVQIYKKDV